MIQPPPHTPLVLHTGTYRCIDRECPEYLTADGYDDPAVDRCLHVTTTVVCGLCSSESDGYYLETVPWPCSEATSST